MDERLLSQIIEIRDSGVVNMFDTNKVRCIAMAQGFVELVDYIEADPTDYQMFILNGKSKRSRADALKKYKAFENMSHEDRYVEACMHLYRESGMVCRSRADYRKEYRELTARGNKSIYSVIADYAVYLEREFKE